MYIFVVLFYLGERQEFKNKKIINQKERKENGKHNLTLASLLTNVKVFVERLSDASDLCRRKKNY